MARKVVPIVRSAPSIPARINHIWETQSVDSQSIPYPCSANFALQPHSLMRSLLTRPGTCSNVEKQKCRGAHGIVDDFLETREHTGRKLVYRTMCPDDGYGGTDIAPHKPVAYFRALAVIQGGFQAPLLIHIYICNTIGGDSQHAICHTFRTDKLTIKSAGFSSAEQLILPLHFPRDEQNLPERMAVLC